MSLANLLPPLNKSWADEVNDEFEEQSPSDNFSTSHNVDISRLSHESNSEEAETVPPDFFKYAALDLLDDECIVDSYTHASDTEMSNNERVVVATTLDEMFLPGINTSSEFTTMNTPRTLFYSNSGPKAVHSFLDINLGNEKHDETSRDEGQKGATTVHEDSIDTWQDHDDDIPDSLDDYNSGTESVRASPDLSSSVFSDNSSQYSSQTEGDEKEFLSDHPLMGKDVIGIRKSFAAVKSSEYDAHPPKSIYRGFEPQIWEWKPSNLRCCQTVIRDDGLKSNKG